MTQPLDHILVLDMSRILAGPWSGQTFADLGAEEIVKNIKVGVLYILKNLSLLFGSVFLRLSNIRDT